MVGKAKGNSEIVVTPNKYKDTLDDLIDSSDAESPDWQGLIDKGSRNMPRFEDSLTGLLERDFLEKDISNRLSWLAFKTRDSQVN